MNGMGKKIRSCIMSLSYRERRKRELERFGELLENYRNMADDELKFEYIRLKTEYGHKKGLLLLTELLIAAAVLTAVWTYFFLFLEQTLQYAAAIGRTDIAGVIFRISAIVAVSVTVLILAWMRKLTDDVKETGRKYMMAEYVINERKGK